MERVNTVLDVLPSLYGFILGGGGVVLVSFFAVYSWPSLGKPAPE